jgi:hypothetical protein
LLNRNAGLTTCMNLAQNPYTRMKDQNVCWHISNSIHCVYFVLTVVLEHKELTKYHNPSFAMSITSFFFLKKK